MNRAKRDAPTREAGAAAVEFALVSGLLFTVMFGILQYGLFFNDSLNTRQGVREAARQGVVEGFLTPPAGCTSGTNSAKLACMTRQQVSPTTGTVYAKVSVAATSASNDDSWAKSKPLIVCAAVKEATVGFLPMPNGGWIYSKTQMSIEQEAGKANWAASGGFTDTLPAGGAWPSGC